MEETENSAVYQKIKPAVERILNAIVVENFSENSKLKTQNSKLRFDGRVEYRTRKYFEGIVDALENHPQLKDKDLYLLTELDYGMARSGNRFVAQELAKRLKLNYAFAPVYIALQKGSGVESDSDGENTKSIHGLAMFSKFPLKNVARGRAAERQRQNVGQRKTARLSARA